MSWAVLVADEFEPELLALPEAVQDSLFELVRVLQQFEPATRPAACRHVERLKTRQHERAALRYR
jgi:hypothetical protein